MSLYIYRYEVEVERENAREEAEWARTRILWSDFRNANFKKKVKPSDLIKLSFDKKVEHKRMSPKEMKEMFGSKFNKLNGN